MWVGQKIECFVEIIEIVLHETEVEGIISHLKNFANEMLPRDDSEQQLRTYALAPM